MKKGTDNRMHSQFLKFCLFFSPCIGLLCCTSTEKHQNANQILNTTHSKNYEYSEIKDLLVDSTIFLRPSVVHLQTTDQSLVVQVDKVAIDDLSIFLLDKKASKVFKFDNTGNYIDKLDRTGAGPMEYRRIMDFCIDPEAKELFVLCEYPYKIYVYDYNFNFVREINNKKLYLELALYQDKIFCRNAPCENNEITPFHVDILNRNTGAVEKSVLPIIPPDGISYQALPLNKGSLLTNQREPIISVPERNFLYSLTDENIGSPKYTFTPQDTLGAKGIYNATETENFLVFTSNNLFSVLDKKENTLLGYRYGVFNTNFLNASINRLVPSNLDNGIILTIYPDYIKQIEKSIIDAIKENTEAQGINTIFLNFAKTLQADDNPVLVIYKLK